MVLGDLGKRITAAVRKMSSNPVFDEDVLNDMLKEIAMALMAVSAASERHEMGSWMSELRDVCVCVCE